jgi:hypothetical protein
MNNYATMKEIGSHLGLSSHQVGRRLKELGLRTQEGKPSQKAFQNGYCAQRWSQDGMNYLWAWHEEKTLRLLAEKYGEAGRGTQTSRGHSAESLPQRTRKPDDVQSPPERTV